MKKSIFVWLYIILVLTIGTAYAAGAGNLNFYGMVYINDYTPDQEFMFFPPPDSNGSYFTSTNIPAGLTIGEQNWINNVFSLNIYKTNQGNNGNVSFTLDFNLANVSTVPWTYRGVTVDHSYTSASKSNESMFAKAPTFQPAVGTVVQPGARTYVRFVFSGKITNAVTDAIMFHATYNFPLPEGGTVTGVISFRLQFVGVGRPLYTAWPST